MIIPKIDSQRQLDKHFKWELERLARALKKCMIDRGFDASQLVRDRIVSASSLAAFLDSYQPIDIATLTMIVQSMGFDFCLDFRDPSNKAARVIVRLPNAKNADSVRAINSGFRTLLKGRTVSEVAYAARLSLSTVYNFTRVVPQYSFILIAVTVPDLFSVFKCARGCGYETYLWMADPLVSQRIAG